MRKQFSACVPSAGAVFHQSRSSLHVSDETSLHFFILLTFLSILFLLSYLLSRFLQESASVCPHLHPDAILYSSFCLCNSSSSSTYCFPVNISIFIHLPPSCLPSISSHHLFMSRSCVHPSTRSQLEPEPEAQTGHWHPVTGLGNDICCLICQINPKPSDKSSTGHKRGPYPCLVLILSIFRTSGGRQSSGVGKVTGPPH